MTDAWWQRLPQRCLDENDQLQQLQAEGLISDFQWESRTGDLRVATSLVLPGKEQPVEIRFPARYPGECPSVLPRPYGTRLSSHQFGGDGVLCLELGPDNWHPRYGAADMLRSAWKLLAYEEINSVLPRPLPIPSRHVETPGSKARGKPCRMILPEGVRLRLETTESWGTFGYTVVATGAAMVFWPLEVPTGEPISSVPPSISAGSLRQGLFVRVAVDAPPLPVTLAALREYISAHGLKPPAEAPQASLILFVKSGQEIDAHYVIGDDVYEVVLLPVPTVPPNERSSSSLLARTSTVNVGIIGVGSIGSKVATSLARSGVRHFVLVDGDVFLPENVVRHEGTYMHAGLMKTDLAKVLIEAVASAPTEIRGFEHAVGDASNADVHARTLEALSGVDVIVDATASGDGFNILSSLASDARHPLVWGEVFAGGLGGLVAYAHPKLTPCPSCVRAAFIAHADEWPPAPRGADDAAYAGEDAGRPMIATDADVTVIAGLLAATTLHMIDVPDELGPAVTLVGFRRGWIFSRPLETHHVQVRTDDFRCQWCWTPPTSSDPSLLRRVEALLNPSSNDHDPSGS